MLNYRHKVVSPVPARAGAFASTPMLGYLS